MVGVYVDWIVAVGDCGLWLWLYAAAPSVDVKADSRLDRSVVNVCGGRLNTAGIAVSYNVVRPEACNRRHS